MGCITPIRMYRSMVANKEGRYGLLSSRYAVARAEYGQSTLGEEVRVPCGRCIQCRIYHRREMSIRLYHEFMMCGRIGEFLTLTYNNASLPADHGLQKRDLSTFMKALRGRYGAGIRFYGCGEYGNHGTRRPHYHLLLFNFRLDADDKKFRMKRGMSKYVSYESKALEKIWKRGFVAGGEISELSIAYCCGYVVDKLDGELGEVERMRFINGRPVANDPEFAEMSTHPGIGASYVERAEFRQSMIDHGNVIWRGKPAPIPRYYIERIREIDPAGYRRIREMQRAKGVAYAALCPEESTNRRLAVSEVVTRARISLKRKGSL